MPDTRNRPDQCHSPGPGRPASVSIAVWICYLSYRQEDLTVVSPFKAFRVFEEDGRIRGRVVDLTLDDLTPGEVVIKAAYSSVNYKDALAATGTGKIMRRFPLVGGVDVAGIVE